MCPSLETQLPPGFVAVDHCWCWEWLRDGHERGWLQDRQGGLLRARWMLLLRRRQRLLLLQCWLLLLQALLHLVELACSLLLLAQHLGQRLRRSQMLRQRWLLRGRLLLLQGLLLAEDLLLRGRGHALGGRRTRRRKGMRRKLLMLHRLHRLLHRRLRCIGGLRRLGAGVGLAAAARAGRTGWAEPGLGLGLEAGRGLEPGLEPRAPRARSLELQVALVAGWELGRLALVG